MFRSRSHSSFARVTLHIVLKDLPDMGCYRQLIYLVAPHAWYVRVLLVPHYTDDSSYLQLAFQENGLSYSDAVGLTGVAYPQHLLV